MKVLIFSFRLMTQKNRIFRSKIASKVNRFNNTSCNTWRKKLTIPITVIVIGYLTGVLVLEDCSNTFFYSTKYLKITSCG
ncbi:hypothetical protein D0629_25975 [Salmonella enterica]|nr:hypothetical protein [Salmonella enterica]EBJ8772770.1 hypothetical protein [Salmonella enterica]